MNRQKPAAKPPLKSLPRSAASTAGKRPPQQKSVRKKRSPKRNQIKQSLPLLALECLGLAASAVLATMMALGYSANLFSGSGFFSNLLPFAVNLDVKRIELGTDVKTATGAFVTNLAIDPVIVGVGVGWRF